VKNKLQFRKEQKKTKKADNKTTY